MLRNCVLISAILLSAFCAAEETGRTLDVFAAASLTESFREIGQQFEAAHPGAKVNFSFGASNQLRTQLEHGATADVFASANTKEMDAAVKAGLAAPEQVKIFARNRLVVIYPKDNPGKVAALADLARPGVKLVLADAAVPVGKYALDMLAAMESDPAFGSGFKQKALANVVSREDSVKSVVTKIRLGAADAGVVYVSDLTPAAMKELGKLDVPDAFNQIAQYPLAALKNAPQHELAGAFLAHVLSAAGQQILAKYGFLAAPDEGMKERR